MGCNRGCNSNLICDPSNTLVNIDNVANYCCYDILFLKEVILVKSKPPNECECPNDSEGPTEEIPEEPLPPEPDPEPEPTPEPTPEPEPEEPVETNKVYKGQIFWGDNELKNVSIKSWLDYINGISTQVTDSSGQVIDISRAKATATPSAETYVENWRTDPELLALRASLVESIESDFQENAERQAQGYRGNAPAEMNPSVTYSVEVICSDILVSLTDLPSHDDILLETNAVLVEGHRWMDTEFTYGGDKKYTVTGPYKRDDIITNPDFNLGTPEQFNQLKFYWLESVNNNYYTSDDVRETLELYANSDSVRVEAPESLVPEPINAPYNNLGTGRSRRFWFYINTTRISKYYMNGVLIHDTVICNASMLPVYDSHRDINLLSVDTLVDADKEIEVFKPK